MRPAWAEGTKNASAVSATTRLAKAMENSDCASQRIIIGLANRVPILHPFGIKPSRPLPPRRIVKSADTREIRGRRRSAYLSGENAVGVRILISCEAERL